jgi:hypothetical protein
VLVLYSYWYLRTPVVLFKHRDVPGDRSCPSTALSAEGLGEYTVDAELVDERRMGIVSWIIDASAGRTRMP